MKQERDLYCLSPTQSSEGKAPRFARRLQLPARDPEGVCPPPLLRGLGACCFGASGLPARAGPVERA
eukprot:524741-Alexandrium_andersonii.AAC.1